MVVYHYDKALMSSVYTANNKTIAKNTIYLYLRMIVSLAISLYTSRAFLDALGIDDYGIYNVVGGFVALLNVITSSLIQGAQRFITFELGKGDAQKLHRTFATFSTLFFLMAIVIFVIGTLLGAPLISRFLVIPEGRIDAAIFVFYCSLGAFAINLIAIPYNACVIAHEKMKFYALVSISESLGKLLIVYALYVTSFDRLKVYALLIVALGLVIRLAYGIYCSKHFPETKTRFFLDKTILKEVTTFSLWMALGGIAVTAKEQGVNVVINLFCGVAINAARGVSMQVSSILGQFASSIAFAITPQITKSYAEGNFQRSVNLTFLLTKVQGVMLFLIAIPLYFEIDFLLALWLKCVPYYANVFAQWALIVTFLSTIRNTYGPLYLATGDVKTLQWTISLIYVLILPFSYVALKLGYEPVSTMQITAIIEVITWLASFYYMKYKFKFPLGQYIIKIMLRLISVFTITVVILILLQKLMVESSFLRLLIITAISTFVILILSYMLLLSNSERVMVNDFINKKLYKK